MRDFGFILYTDRRDGIEFSLEQIDIGAVQIFGDYSDYDIPAMRGIYTKDTLRAKIDTFIDTPPNQDDEHNLYEATLLIYVLNIWRKHPHLTHCEINYI